MIKITESIKYNHFIVKGCRNAGEIAYNNKLKKHILNNPNALAYTEFKNCKQKEKGTDMKFINIENIDCPGCKTVFDLIKITYIGRYPNPMITLECTKEGQPTICYDVDRGGEGYTCIYDNEFEARAYVIDKRATILCAKQFKYNTDYYFGRDEEENERDDD